MSGNENPKYKFIIEMTGAQANESTYYLGKAGIPFHPIEQHIYYSQDMDMAGSLRYGKEIPYLHSCVSEWTTDTDGNNLLKDSKDWGYIESDDFLKMATEEFEWIDNGIEKSLRPLNQLVDKYPVLFKITNI